MFAENVDAFLNSVSGHAIDATLDPGGANTAVKILFDANYQEALGVAGTRPLAIGRSSVFGAGAIGQTLVISGVSYSIIGREPIDDGVFVNLPLKRL